MSDRKTLDLSGLPLYSISTQAPLWWGQLLLAAIEGATFCILIAVYFYMRLSVDVWPPPGIHPTQWTLSTIALVPLLLSGFGSYWASEGAKKNDRRAMLYGLGLNVALALVFLFLRAIWWRSLNFTWESDAYGTIVWSILFLHTLDSVCDIVFTLILIVIVAIGKCGPRQRLGVHVDSVIWYFVIIVWLPLYGVLVWGPAIIGGPK